MFTDTDTFGVDFMQAQNQWIKQILLALTFAIDEDIFEKSKAKENIERDSKSLVNVIKKIR
jgi:hypothetical protein